MTFLPNVHDSRQGGITDTLYIYITSEVPTSGVIRYRNRLNQIVADPFTISNPNQVFIYRINYFNVELRGYFSGSGQADAINFANSQSERVAPQHVRVTANDDVTVYGLNQAFFTSDAFLALPTTALGREYVVMAYKSDARGQNFTGNDRDETSTPSQFAVVATEDATDVVIRPSAPVFFGGTIATLRTRLNQGESYLVQADPRTLGGLADLTGTRIIASKPVAVFAGHQRTTLPVEFRPNLTSRDHLVEQLPGLETWGRRSFITPFRASSNEIEVGTNLFRVLAAYDTTRVFFNGQPMVTLNAGQYFEAPLTSTATITASDLIQVAQFKKTSGAGNLIGDPFMLLVPTVEQYDRSYRFINAEVSDRNLQVAPNGQVFSEHFVTMVVPTVAIGSLRLDDQAVAAGSFQAIPNSQGYSFANISVRGGVHTARCDSAFAIYVYGYGVMNSYGYIGGGRLRIIAPDRDAPLLVVRDTCFGVSGAVYDTVLTDSRIASVQALMPRNVNVTIDRFTPFADSVRFRATLQNTLQDGEFTLEARDSAGFVTRRRFLIPGATVALEGQNASQSAQNLRFSLANGTSRTFRLPIQNYGETTQTITTLNLSNDAGNSVNLRLISPGLPLVLPAGARDTVVIALENAPLTTLRATLSLGTACLTKNIALLTIEAGRDTSSPSVSVERNFCERRATLRASDSEPFPSGLARVEVIGTPQNSTVTVQNPSILPNGTQAREIIVNIINPRQDAVFALQLTDSAGNTRIIRDTLQGFTISIVRTSTTGTWGEVPITGLVCQSIEIRNQGLLPFTFGRITPRGNRHFSTADSQFPLTIPAGASRRLQVCFAPLELINYADSLVLEGFCVQEVLRLTGRGLPLDFTQNTRCDAVVQLRTSIAPLRFFMEQNFPNPSQSGQTLVRVGIPQTSAVSFVVYSMLGSEISRQSLGVLTEGEHEITLDVSRLETGTYFYAIESSPLETSPINKDSAGAATMQKAIKQMIIVR